MAALDRLALAWTPHQLQLWTVDGPAVSVRASFEAATAMSRYDILLRMGSAGSGYIRAAVEPRVPFLHVDRAGREISPVQAVPGTSPVSVTRGRPHRGAFATLISGDTLFVLHGRDRWEERPLPAGDTAQDVSFDPAGGLWVAGTRLWYQRGPGAQFESRDLRLGAWTRARVKAGGGLDTLRTMDAEERPFMATSDCAWLLDDMSSFVFWSAQGDDWKALRLRDEPVRRVTRSRPGHGVVFGVDGSILHCADPGRMNRLDARPGLRAALGPVAPSGPDLDLMIRGADAVDDAMMVAVGLFTQSGETLTWHVTAVCESADGGHAWRTLAQTRPEQGEPGLIDVAYVSSGST